MSIGSYPFFKDGRFGANFVVRSEDEAVAERCAGQLRGRLAEAGYEAIDGGI